MEVHGGGRSSASPLPAGTVRAAVLTTIGLLANSTAEAATTR